MSDSPFGLSMYELNVRLLGAAQGMGASLERIAENLERIARSIDQMANDDPLSRVERALERAPEVLGYDPATASAEQQRFDNRFSGGPLEERMR